MIKTLNTTTGKVTIGIPAELNQVTLGQLIALQQVKDFNELEAISILSGTSLSEIQNVKNAVDLQPFVDQVSALAQQITLLHQSNTVPQKVTFNLDEKPVSIKVMQNLSVEPAGAFMAAREIIADEIAKHIKQHGEADLQNNFSLPLPACAQILAQYFYCRATAQPYNEYAAAEFEEQVKLLPVTDALPIARCFFLSYPNLSRPRTNYWQRLQRLWSSAPA